MLKLLLLICNVIFININLLYSYLVYILQEIFFNESEAKVSWFIIVSEIIIYSLFQFYGLYEGVNSIWNWITNAIILKRITPVNT